MLRIKPCLGVVVRVQPQPGGTGMAGARRGGDTPRTLVYRCALDEIGVGARRRPWIGPDVYPEGAAVVTALPREAILSGLPPSESVGSTEHSEVAGACSHDDPAGFLR